MDRGLGEILFAGAPVCLPIGSPVAGPLWSFRISGFAPVVLSVSNRSHGPGTLHLAGITDMDRGLGEILSKFGTRALVWPLVGSP